MTSPEMSQALERAKLWAKETPIGSNRVTNTILRDMATQLIALHEENARMAKSLEKHKAAVDAVAQHEASNFMGKDSAKNCAASWRGVMRAVRAALQQGKPE